ncbi:MAG: hypothetical protein KFF72_03500 [Arthrospira sp. SH-MAG29]|nr:hypothetical protein [Arthrospira sp. SH-MAG29]MBS0015425.1 hypothetical protein [Arthrospira sp. SH-MAG29]
MEASNERNQTTKKEDPQHAVRGEQEVSLDDVNGNSRWATGPDGYGAKSESVRVGGTDCQGDNFQSSRESVPGTGGKILDLLEELFAGFHEYVKSHEARLEQRLEANRDYQSRMKKQMENIRQEILQQVSK